MLINPSETINQTSSQFKSLNEFLIKHSTKHVKEGGGENVVATHTRIANKELNIYGGSYVIPKEDLKEFYGLYYEHVFVKKNKEYLTEKQLSMNSSLVIDFDFRYAYEVDERKHTKEHIYDMVSLYLDELKEYFIFKENEPFDVYIFEKPNVNRLNDKSLTKDGIHMMIGIQMDHIMQTMFREKMITKLEEIWDLPLLNDYGAVLDEGISKGSTNWQLYGSRKPDNEAYELSYHFSITYDNRDGEFMMDELKVQNFDIKNNFYKLSVQNSENPIFEMNPKILDTYNNRLDKKSKPKKKRSTKINFIVDSETDEPEDETLCALDEISNYEQLQKMVDFTLEKIKKNKPCDYNDIYETHLYAQALPSKYYEPGSHLLNRQVAFALKDTDDSLFLSWIMIRSKASDFDYSTIPKLFEDWSKYFNISKSGITKRSIMYWCKEDNFEEYQKIKETTLDYYIEEVIATQTENDMAHVFKHMYKDKYVFIPSKNGRGTWMFFKTQMWIEDKMVSILLKMSKEVHAVFSKWREKCQEEYHHCSQNDDSDKIEYLKKKIKVISDLMGRLKTATNKKNYLIEASQLFYDNEFMSKVNANRDLICFKNGVMDFKNKVFRDGRPDDYITKCTNIDYLPYDVHKDKPEFKEIETQIYTMMKQIFPNEDLYRFMFEHWAATLPTDKNQSFYMYYGCGSNGKSIITDIMKHTLGDYKGTVPVTLVTEKRNAIGGTSSEIMQLKDIRYAVMQELSKGAVINEGIMKELTGGDPIQGRSLFCESETFDPMFSLVVCTNNLPKFKDLSVGTWRRIKVVRYCSKFVDDGDVYDDDTEHVYKKDKNLKDKFPVFAPVFASILVKIALEKQGIVEDCECVMEETNKYRMSQDHISAFVKGNIIKTNNKNDRIKKQELTNHFKFWFSQEQGTERMPPGEELYAYMDKRFGFHKTGKNGGWFGVKILYPEDDELEIDDNL
jgi:P4 family phage/plasmid primase-like protien